MHLTVNGARIHYERTGSGFPVIFLHAGIADSRMWEPQEAAFTQQFEMIRPDMRGFGESDLPAAAWNPRADLLGLMEHLNLKPAHLVGCSMGGALAIDFALDHPERVSKLVVVDGGLSGRRSDPKHDHLFAGIMAAEKSGDMRALNEAEMHLWLDGPYRPHGYVAGAVRDLFLDMNGKNMENDWSTAPQEQLDPPAAKRLAEVTAPTLVIVGDKDLEPVLETADELVSSIKGARKAVIHDAAHLPNLEHPEEFNRVVLDFLLS